MTVDTVMHWVGPVLDLLALALLAGVVWRLGRDPGAAWSEREGRLQTIFDDLRALVAQSEGLARELDAKLADRETRLQALLASAPTNAAATRGGPSGRERIEVRGSHPADARGETVALDVTAREITALADAGTPVDEIARRVGVAAAEVRLVIGLRAARAGRRRAATGEAAAHAR
jgi:hypothetical protein